MSFIKILIFVVAVLLGHAAIWITEFYVADRAIIDRLVEFEIALTVGLLVYWLLEKLAKRFNLQ